MGALFVEVKNTRRELIGARAEIGLLVGLIATHKQSAATDGTTFDRRTVRAECCPVRHYSADESGDSP